MTLPGVDGCWGRIGVTGDGTCPELAAVIHCRNCPVFLRAGRSLLERELPAGYVSEWTTVLAQEKEAASSETFSLVVFRLGGELLSFGARAMREVRPGESFHRIPHVSNELLVGLVNIRGEIQPCFALARLLEIEQDDRRSWGSPWQMVVLESAGEAWVLLVDEVVALHRFDPEAMTGVPVTVAKAQARYTQGIFEWDGRRVGLLDDGLVIADLRRRLP